MSSNEDADEKDGNVNSFESEVKSKCLSVLHGRAAVSFAHLNETSVRSDINGMDPDVVVSTRLFRNIGLSKAALTHRLRRLRTPSKCRECDCYVYFQGAECEEVRRRPLERPASTL